MKVGIYNTYVNTMGGGEKHMGAIAEYFSRKPGVSVDIITEQSIDIHELSKKLQLSLEKCSVVVLQEKGKPIELVSQEYDLFINSTHWSAIKPQGKKNAILIFFPIIPAFRFIARSRVFKRFLSLLDFSQAIFFEEGFYSKEKVGKYFSRQFGQWTKKQFSFRLSVQETAIPYTIILKRGGLRKEALDALIQSVTTDDGEQLQYEVREDCIRIFITPKKETVYIQIQLQTAFQPNNSDTRELGIFVTGITLSPPWNHIKKRALFFLARLCEPIQHYNYLQHYDIVMTNSEYTKGWLQKLWRTNSHVIYPIIDIKTFANNAQKKKIILSVGRFFAGGHNKKHVVMIQAFKKMFLQGKTGDWEYHLCGGSHPEKEHQAYLQEVQDEALGYPITVHPDIPFDELKKLYGEATIFWHAAGFGENENEHPDRFEHFGITTVEAMSAGCIPVVIGKAGQKEIVRNGENGYLWETVAELQQKTAAVMNQTDEERKIVAQKAIETSVQFDADSCHKRLDAIFKDIL